MMRHYGAEKFVKVCEGLYRGVETRVVMNGVKSRWLCIEMGLRQGCPLSPLLFNIYMMGMVEELERAQLGVERWCGALMYADNIVLAADSGMGLSTMLEVVQVYVMRWRMKFNDRKSKIMVPKGCTQCAILTHWVISNFSPPNEKK